MADWQKDIEALRAAIRDLATKVGELERSARSDDERDHLRQIHYLLTSAKGHIGAVRVAREKAEHEGHNGET